MATQTQVMLHPLVTFDQLIQHSEVMRVGFVSHHPPACHHLQLPRLQQADQSEETVHMGHDLKKTKHRMKPLNKNINKCLLTRKDIKAKITV